MTWYRGPGREVKHRRCAEVSEWSVTGGGSAAIDCGLRLSAWLHRQLLPQWYRPGDVAARRRSGIGVGIGKGAVPPSLRRSRSSKVQAAVVGEREWMDRHLRGAQLGPGWDGD